MNCEDFELYGSAYIDNMLSNKENLEFETHINECECCDVKFKNLKIIIDSTNEIEEMDLPINFSSELKTKLETEKINVTKNMVFNKKKILSAIAAGIFIIITSVSLFNNSSIHKNRDDLYSEMDEISKNQEKVEFNMASEKSTETSDNIVEKSTNQPRMMSIDNIDENQKEVLPENIEEINEENTYKINTAKNNEGYLEDKHLGSQPIENRPNKTMDLFVLMSTIVGVGILIYKRLKK